MFIGGTIGEKGKLQLETAQEGIPIEDLPFYLTEVPAAGKIRGMQSISVHLWSDTTLGRLQRSQSKRKSGGDVQGSLLSLELDVSTSGSV